MSDTSAIASLSTSLSSARTEQAIQIAVLKTALDSETLEASSLLSAIPPVPSVPNLPAHLGNSINTTA